MIHAQKNADTYLLCLPKTMGLLMFYLLFIQSVKAQIPVEVFIGNNQAQHEFFFFKDLGQNHKVNLFSMARFAVNYEDETLNTSMVSSQLTYNFTKNWGISTGGLFTEPTFSPLLAISYVYFNPKGDLFLNFFPTVYFQDNLEFELFGLFFYTPKLSEKWSLFSQVIFGTAVNQQFDQHVFSYQQIRLGLGYKKSFQFGVGIDQNFFGNSWMYAENIGLFIRKEL